MNNYAMYTHGGLALVKSADQRRTERARRILRRR